MYLLEMTTYLISVFIKYAVLYIQTKNVCVMENTSVKHKIESKNGNEEKTEFIKF